MSGRQHVSPSDRFQTTDGEANEAAQNVEKRREIQAGGVPGASLGGTRMTQQTEAARKHEEEAKSDDVLCVEYWDLDRLVPYARNARTHSDAQIAEIAGSIRTFGFANPILVGEDGDVIAGHGRLAAARLLRFTDVPVIVLRGLSEIERRQLVLADNRIALNAGWDAEMLRLELKDLTDLGADLSMLGFDKKELSPVAHGSF